MRPSVASCPFAPPLSRRIYSEYDLVTDRGGMPGLTTRVALSLDRALDIPRLPKGALSKEFLHSVKVNELGHHCSRRGCAHWFAWPLDCWRAVRDTQRVKWQLMSSDQHSRDSHACPSNDAEHPIIAGFRSFGEDWWPILVVWWPVWWNALQPAIWQWADESCEGRRRSAPGTCARAHSGGPARCKFVPSSRLGSRACHTPRVGLLPVEADRCTCEEKKKADLQGEMMQE